MGNVRNLAGLANYLSGKEVDKVGSLDFTGKDKDNWLEEINNIFLNHAPLFKRKSITLIGIVNELNRTKIKDLAVDFANYVNGFRRDYAEYRNGEDYSFLDFDQWGQDRSPFIEEQMVKHSGHYAFFFGILQVTNRSVVNTRIIGELVAEAIHHDDDWDLREILKKAMNDRNFDMVHN